MKIDKFHKHEVLDRIYVIQSNINDFLVEHPVIKSDKKMKKKLEKVQSILGNIYQEVGKQQWTIN